MNHLTIAAAAIAGVIVLMLTLTIIGKNGEISDLNNQLTDSQVKLLVADANVTSLTAAVNDQNAAIAALAKDSKNRMDATTQALGKLTTVTAAIAAASHMSAPLTAVSECDRVKELDARLMESLK